MLKRLSEKEQIAILLDTYSLEIRTAFLEAVADIRSRITLQAIVERLEIGDVAGAIEALHLERSAFNKVLDAIAVAFNAGGTAAVDALPTLRDPSGHRLVIRFDARNIQAENWLREHSSTLVTRIVDDQREGLRAVLQEGVERGNNPVNITATDIVGHKSKTNGERVGGLIGLDDQQIKTAARIKQIMVSNDVEGMKAYLGVTNKMLELPRRELLKALKDTGLKLRDRRFDSGVLDAVQGRARIGAGGASKIFTQYSQRALVARGKRIAHNETMTALAKSKHEAIAQQIAAGKLDAQDVTKVWKHTPQEHPRLNHVAMNGKSVGWNEDFVLPNGVRMEHPHDPNAPATETLFCKCTYETRIDFAGRLARKRRQ